MEEIVDNPAHLTFRKVAAGVATAAVLLTSLLTAWRHDFLLFHILAEFFSIAVACGIFMLVWNARRYLGQGYLLFVGIAYVFVAAIDLLHTLAYSGMDIIHGYGEGTNLATQLWVAGRYLQASSLVIAPLFLRRRLKYPGWVAIAVALVTGVLVGLIFRPDIWPFKRIGFPLCHDGQGLTPFKVYSEYIICVLLATGLGLLLRGRKLLDRHVCLLIAASIALTIISEIAFTLYASVDAPANGIGHIAKIVAFYLMYLAVIDTGLAKPYSIFLRDLKRSEEALRDSQGRLQSVIMSSPMGIILYDLHDGGDMVLAEMNRAAGRILGIRREEFIGKTLEEAFPGLTKTKLPWQFRQVATTGAPWSCREFSYDYGEIKGLFEITAFQVSPLRMAVMFEDVTQTRRAERRLEFSYRLLEIANRHAEMAPALNDFLAEIRQFTGVGAAAIRILNEDGSIPYYAVNGFSREFYEAENFLSIDNDPCMCVRVVMGETSPGLPFFTKGGSFFVNNTVDYVATCCPQTTGPVRNACHAGGYMSVALIPIRAGGRIIGLIHLADPAKGAVPRETVEALEHAAMELGAAIQRVQIEDRLRALNAALEQRVAERTADLANTIEELQGEVRERIEIEDALRKSEATIRSSFAELDMIYETTPVGLCLLDRNLRYIRVNERLASMDGRPAEAHLGATPAEVTPELADQIEPICRRVLETGQPAEDLELAGPAKAYDDKHRPTAWILSCFPLNRFGGGVDGVGMVVRDISNRRRLESEVLRVSEMERQRIGRDLHDSLGQVLGGLSCLNSAFTQKLATQAPQLVPEAEKIGHLLTGSLNLTRSLARGLRPVGLTPDGLAVALRELANNVETMFGVSCAFQSDEDIHVGDAMAATHLYHIVQEATSNAARHGRAGHVTITLTRQDGATVLCVRDDGKGFDPTKVNGEGMGLRIMQYRAWTIGASFDVESTPGNGTTVQCRLPDSRQHTATKE